MTELPKDEPTSAPTEEPTEEPDSDEQTTPEPTEQPIDAPDDETIPAPDESGNNTNAALYVIIALLALLVAGGAFYIVKNGKGQIHNEKTSDTSADVHDDDGDGDTRSGG